MIDKDAAKYQHYILSQDEEIVREVQSYCADIADKVAALPDDWADGDDWTPADGEHIAALLNKSANPVALFRYMDEKTGSMEVGYRTQDGREWFHILRQMRNTRGSGLLENLGGGR